MYEYSTTTTNTHTQIQRLVITVQMIDIGYELCFGNSLLPSGDNLLGTLSDIHLYSVILSDDNWVDKHAS